MKTKNYSFFSYSPNNREIKQANVAKLTESFRKYGFIQGRPVLCTKFGVIIDGQHRFEAAKALNIEVQYEFVQDDYNEKMIALNSTQSRWALGDYIQSFSNQNIDCFRKLDKFQEKYKMGISNSISIFIDVDSKKISNTIREGKTFNINPNAEKIAEFILNCSFVPYNKNHKFIKAIIIVFKKCDSNQILKIKQNLMSVPQFAKSSDYLVAFENILNKRTKNKVELR